MRPLARVGLAPWTAEQGRKQGDEQLFGNAGGFDNGYSKLALIWLAQMRLALAAQPGRDGAADLIPQYREALGGHGLDGLKVWVDRNHDARVQPGEVHTLQELGITEVSVFPHDVKNRDGESLLRGTYRERGKQKLAEDVWFAIDPAGNAATPGQVAGEEGNTSSGPITARPPPWPWPGRFPNARRSRPYQGAGE